MESQIEVYIGQDEDFLVDRICVDLNVSGKCFPLYSSKSLAISTEQEEFDSYLQEALNIAKLVSSIGLEVCVSDSVLDFANEISEEFSKKIKKLCKEVL